MKEIVLRYLNEQYVLKLSSYVSYIIFDTNDSKEVGLFELKLAIKKIFDISDFETDAILDIWSDEQAIRVQNSVSNIRKELNKITGIELQLTSADLNNLMAKGYTIVDIDYIG